MNLKMQHSKTKIVVDVLLYSNQKMAIEVQHSPCSSFKFQEKKKKVLRSLSAPAGTEVKSPPRMCKGKLVLLNISLIIYSRLNWLWVYCICLYLLILMFSLSVFMIIFYIIYRIYYILYFC